MLFPNLYMKIYQLGVQHTDDDILRKINRGCYTDDTIRALRLLKDSCFKVDIHLMPNLPGSTIAKDEYMFQRMLTDSDLQADQWKIYPCETVPWTVIKKWYEEGKYKPYSENELLELLIRVKRYVHPWIRLNRVIRDIPAQYIIAGLQNTSLRQVIQLRMEERGFSCKCIRCREVGVDRPPSEDVELVTRSYLASGGIEYFISVESKDHTIILGFLRLRINSSVDSTVMQIETNNGCAHYDRDVLYIRGPQQRLTEASRKRKQLRRRVRSKSPALTKEKTRKLNDFENNEETCSLSPFTELNGAALIRELHVYGQLISTCSNDTINKAQHVQHTGIGKSLMREAERISLEKHGAKKIVVISGVGVRDFYRKLEYNVCSESGGFMMIKVLKDSYILSWRRSARKILQNPRSKVLWKCIFFTLILYTMTAGGIKVMLNHLIEAT